MRTSAHRAVVGRSEIVARIIAVMGIHVTTPANAEARHTSPGFVANHPRPSETRHDEPMGEVREFNQPLRGVQIAWRAAVLTALWLIVVPLVTWVLLATNVVGGFSAWRYTLPVFLRRSRSHGYWYAGCARGRRCL